MTGCFPAALGMFALKGGLPVYGACRKSVEFWGKANEEVMANAKVHAIPVGVPRKLIVQGDVPIILFRFPDGRVAIVSEREWDMTAVAYYHRKPTIDFPSILNHPDPKNHTPLADPVTHWYQGTFI